MDSPAVANEEDQTTDQSKESADSKDGDMAGEDDSDCGEVNEAFEENETTNDNLARTNSERIRSEMAKVPYDTRNPKIELGGKFYKEPLKLQ